MRSNAHTRSVISSAVHTVVMGKRYLQYTRGGGAWSQAVQMEGVRLVSLSRAVSQRAESGGGAMCRSEARASSRGLATAAVFVEF